jgi:creatinine amidohydrolase
VVYVARPGWAWDEKTAREMRRLRKTDWGGHADEVETSWMMVIRPDLVQLERAGEESGRPGGRLKHLRGTETGMWWYSDFPDHYAGDARPANTELGELALGSLVKRLVEALRAVKKDEVTRELQEEFHGRAEEPLVSRGRKPQGRRRQAGR